jgi:hypothetical protein
MNKEPTVIIGGIAEIVRAIIPLLLIFGLIHWTDEQTGAVVLFVGVIVGFAEKLYTRTQVIPTETANAQINTAIRMPPDSTLKEVIDKTERDSK